MAACESARKVPKAAARVVAAALVVVTQEEHRMEQHKDNSNVTQQLLARSQAELSTLQAEHRRLQANSLMLLMLRWSEKGSQNGRNM